MTQVTQQPPAKTNGVPVIVEKNIADNVLAKVKLFEETGTINIPKDYSAPNALRAAWLLLQDIKTMDKRPALEVCTKESVANSLLKMVTQGLNPVKRQCSFIVYGNQLTLQREYAGTIFIAKRDANVKSVSANAVFKDDVFEYEINPETTLKKVTKHVQTLESASSMEIKGAYAVVEYNDGTKKTEIMSMAQIRKAWEQGATKGQSPAHKNFPDQMSMKTVINRALKIDVNSSDDAALFDDDDSPADDVKTSFVKNEVAQNANKKELRMESVDDAIVPAANENADKETGEVKELKQTELACPGF